MNVPRHGILVQGLRMSNLFNEYRTIFFWESDANLKILQKISPYIGISYKFFLKYVKTLNRIFWAMEYWFKTLACQIWSTNTKPFFWESESNLRTFQKLPPYVGVAHKFILKCEKSQLIVILVFPNVVYIECSTVKNSTGDNVRIKYK